MRTARLARTIGEFGVHCDGLGDSRPKRICFTGRENKSIEIALCYENERSTSGGGRGTSIRRHHERGARSGLNEEDWHRRFRSNVAS